MLKARIHTHGFELLVPTRRKYAVVTGRPEDYITEAGRYVAYAELRTTSDALDRAVTAANDWEPGPGQSFAVVIDIATDEQLHPVV